MSADFQPLLDALKFSPDNLPLRQHLVRQLNAAGQPHEAEALCREGLRQYPTDDALRLSLAEAYLATGKHSAAFVVVEELLDQHPDHAPAHRLHARLLLATGQPAEARTAYDHAVELDPDAADSALDQALAAALPAPRVPAATGSSSAAPADATTDAFNVQAQLLGLEKPKINFADVGGMEAVKDEIRLKIIHPLQFPDLYKAYGKASGGGLLLYGPPGCGKTHLARATAGEVQASFISVGISDILDMWLGNSEKNLHKVFALARAQAPCVLFFDEVDALAANRHDLRQSAGRTVINQFLEELDGATHSNEGVLIMAATNAPWQLDPAFRRPGRFDRITLVTPPDEPARTAILDILLRGKPLAPGVNVAAVAARTAGLSGADLMALVDGAVDVCLRASMRSGRPLPIEQSHLLDAAKQVKPSTKEWFATARNYALYSNEGGLYDDILVYLGVKKPGGL
ncbi:ATP-binding protein [Hymenobacter negativus]|uniref:AAA family ATPase n=1 Tax=Hymenobacter negativus TaxID=2795026 RepID=A0ABS0Q4V6_9BACT|nr:ATP-binding protein [Hymenobacter negativus]MBH8557517.1 AAA family ATPase [Hymenobacter negativus]